MSTYQSKEEDEKMYKIISDALLDLCENKPNDPIDYLSRKLFELIGDNPEKQMRAVNKRASTKRMSISRGDLFSKSELAVNNLHNDYENDYELGNNIFDNLYIVKDKRDGTKKTMRILRKKNYPNFIAGTNKVGLISEMEHQNILDVLDMRETNKYFCTIEKFCKEGDLFNYFFFHQKEITIELIKEIFRQILSGLNYMHKCGLIHRDLNFKKIFLFQKSLNPNEIKIKIGGFIFSETYNPGEYIEDSIDFEVNNPMLMAPEYFQKKYNNKVDIWSFGIMAYYMLIGKPPFNEEEPGGIVMQITTAPVTFPEGTDPAIQEFLTKLLKKNPEERYSAEEALNSPFLKFEQKFEFNADFSAALNSLTTFTLGEQLRRAVLTYIMSKKLYTETTESMNLFRQIDTDMDGLISKQELMDKCTLLFKGQSTKKMKKNVQKFFETMDINGDGILEYSEFLTIQTMINNDLGIPVIKNIFDTFDHFKKGYIDDTSLREMFESTNLRDAEIQAMIDECDPNGDRKIDFEEFSGLIMFNMPGKGGN